MRRNETPRRCCIRRTSAFLLVCLPTLFAPIARATNDLCGATILADLTLDHDLTCLGDGLIVGVDGIKLNLNGHVITGSGSGVGILVSGRTKVAIVGGTVKGFAVAVRVLESTDILIKENKFQQNPEGVDLQRGSIGNTIKENEFSDSSTRGIMLRSFSSDNVVKENTFTGNRVGILVFGGVENTVKENLLSASSLAAIRLNVIAIGNLIMENTIESNVAGIDFIVTTTGSSTGNSLVENRIAMNDCGLKGPTDGNTFKENVLEANLVDSCQ